MSHRINVSLGSEEFAHWHRPSQNVLIRTVQIYKRPEPCSPRHVLVLKTYSSAVYILKRTINEQNKAYEIVLEIKSTVLPLLPLVTLEFSNDSGVNLEFVINKCRNYNHLDPTKDFATPLDQSDFNEWFPFALAAVTARRSLSVSPLADNLIRETPLILAWNEWLLAIHEDMFQATDIEIKINIQMRHLVRDAAKEAMQTLPGSSAARDVAWAESSSTQSVLWQLEEWQRTWSQSWMKNWTARFAGRRYRVLPVLPDIVRTGLTGSFGLIEVSAVASALQPTSDNAQPATGDALRQYLAHHLTRRSGPQSPTWVSVWCLGAELAWVAGWKHRSTQSNASNGVRIEQVDVIFGILKTVFAWDNDDNGAEEAWSNCDSVNWRRLKRLAPSRVQRAQDRFMSTWQEAWRKTWDETCKDYWGKKWEVGYQMRTTYYPPTDLTTQPRYDACRTRLLNHLRGNDAGQGTVARIQSIFKALDRIEEVRRISGVPEHNLKTTIFHKRLLRKYRKEQNIDAVMSDNDELVLTYLQLQDYIRRRFEPPSDEVLYSIRESLDHLFPQRKYSPIDFNVIQKLWVVSPGP